MPDGRRSHGGAVLLLVLLGSLLPASAGEEVPQAAAPLTLGEAESRALEFSPALKAADARIMQEEGLLRQAGLYPNPDLSVDLTWFTRDYSRREAFLSLLQPIPWHGKRGLEKNVAMEWIEVARRDREIQRLDLLLQVREAFLRVHFAGRTLQLKEESLENARKIQKAVEARVSAGDAAPLESLRTGVEVSRAGSQATLARGEMEAETAALNLLLGFPADAPTRLADPGESLEPAGDLPSLIEHALQTRPEIESREHAAQAAGYSAELARLARRPDIAVGPTFGQDQGANYLGAGLSLRLPLWDRNQGNIAAAEQGLRAATADAEAARLALSQLVSDSYARYRLARTQQLLYEEGLLSRTEELEESARKAYEGGESGILDLLDARRTALAVREEYYRACLDAALAAVRLRRAAGGEAEETP